MRRVLVLGAAGFIGSHLCDALLARGVDVVGIDDLSSGGMRNIEHLAESPNFVFVRSDIAQTIPVTGRFDAVLNFASLASPPRYMAQQLHTLRTGSAGTDNALALATEHGARLIMASTSEVYGDPTEHPQTETYRGNVNPVGPRSCYDEAKRYAEALCMAYHRECGTDTRIVRIFNTYGPRMLFNDGRVVSNFIVQALQNEDITVYGEGQQTRSFCYVDDLVAGIIATMNKDGFYGPVNLGNPNEMTIKALADRVIQLTGSRSKIVHKPLPTDDPTRRQPDISLAKKELGWEPKVDLDAGLKKTIANFEERLRKGEKPR